MDALLRDFVTEGIRVLFLLGFPVIVLGALAGTVVGALQSATSIQDTAARYAARLFGVLVALYFLLPSAGRYLTQLVERAFSP